MITRDVVKKLRNIAGFGNVAVWADDSMTVCSQIILGKPPGKNRLSSSGPSHS